MALPEKPITRTEMYLSKMAGENPVLPEKPITREEMYLDYIAKNGGGGGGSILIDNVPTENSTNAVSSGGVYDALEEKPTSKSTIENYTGSTLAGAAQSPKSAIDGLKTAIDNLAARVAITESEITWLEIAHDMQTGNRDKYAIGDLISDPWTDTQMHVSYDNPWRVNHFDTVETEGGIQIPGMWLQNKYAHPFDVQFSHQRAFLSCPDGLSAGTYYFTFEANWGTNVVAGDAVCFTLTSDVPAGGCLAGCYGAPDQVKTNWRIYAYDADHKTILQTITPTFTSSGTDLGVMKATQRVGNMNCVQEMAYGNNRWKTSALRQYLNSDAIKGEWWIPQDEWDIAPDQLSQKDGYLRGLSQGLRNALVPVKYTTYANTVNDGGAADITYDKVSLISLEQMYINPQITGEGEPHNYWKQLNGIETKWPTGQAIPELIHYAVENHASAQYVRLRSASRGGACSPWIVFSSGGVNRNGASFAYRFAPLVFIG